VLASHVQLPPMDALVRSMLFGLGEQGFMLDPSDAATAFQTSAGTTAGVVGQVLGLRLDKRLGAVRGAELVANGDFSGGTAGWTAVGDEGMTVVGGQLQITRGTTGIRVTQAVPTVVGAKYHFRWTAAAGTGSPLVHVGSALGGADLVGNDGQSGSVGAFFTATGATAHISLSHNGGAAGVTALFDNVSVTRLDGNHALQATSASRPTWAQDGAFYRDTFDGFDDSLSIAAGGGSTTGFFYCGAIHVAGGAGTDRRIVGDNTATTGYVVRVNASDQLELLGGHGAGFAGVATVATLPVGQTHVVTAWDDGVNFKAQIDGGAVASAARPVVVAGTAAITEGKAATGPFLFFNGSLYNRIYRAGPPPDAAQRAAVQRYIASKAGVSL
jgi:hypothetical protein